MSKEELIEILSFVKEDLDRVVSFWLKYSHDDEFGGFFNCIDEDGKIYDETKYIWLQGRQIWTYCKLYNTIERFHKKELLDVAIKGANFLMNSPDIWNKSTYKCCFSCTRDGKPLKIQRTIFSETFYFMGLSELYIATKEERYKLEAIKLFEKIRYWVFTDDSELGRPKLSGNTRVNSLAIPMVMLFLVDQYLNMDDSPSSFNKFEVIDWCIKSILAHLQRNESVVLENVSVDGQEITGSLGRLMNPGHAIEGGWILLSIANRFSDKYEWLKSIAIRDFIEKPYNTGLDAQYGGIFYFLDADNYSPVQLEWDMKLWWVHNEALIAFLMAFNETKSATHLDIFKSLFDYSKKHFIDTVNGEWYGYLNRDGSKSMRFKGGPYKGCFHVPRCLFILELTLEKLIKTLN